MAGVGGRLISLFFWRGEIESDDGSLVDQEKVGRDYYAEWSGCILINTVADLCRIPQVSCGKISPV